MHDAPELQQKLRISNQHKFNLTAAANPNDGSTSSDSTAGSHETSMASLGVPRHVQSRMVDIAPQLYEQDKLAEKCDCSFPYLCEGVCVALNKGIIGPQDASRLKEVNRRANAAKHEHFGASSHQQDGHSGSGASSSSQGFFSDPTGRGCGSSSAASMPTALYPNSETSGRCLASQSSNTNTLPAAAPGAPARSDNLCLHHFQGQWSDSEGNRVHVEGYDVKFTSRGKNWKTKICDLGGGSFTLGLGSGQGCWDFDIIRSTPGHMFWTRRANREPREWTRGLVNPMDAWFLKNG